MPITTTRPARPEDSEFAYQVKRAALGPYVVQLWGWDDAQQREQHVRRFATHEVEIIECDGRDVGVIVAARHSHELLLHQLFILPAYQGSGIGAACLARMLDEARSAAIPIRLQVLQVNTRAQTFYERLGFDRVRETDTHVLMEKLP